MINLDEVTKAAFDVPPLPSTVLRLTALLSTERWNLEDVVEIIRFDSGLAGLLLRRANAAAFARPTRAGTVREAVSRLGLGAVLSATVGRAVQGMLAQGAPALGYGPGVVWRHSVAAALAVELMPRALGRSVSAETETAALLHDIGEQVLWRFVDPKIGDVLQRAVVTSTLGRVGAEAEVLFVNHAEVGGLIAQHWNLPETIVSAIIHHHEPIEGDGDMSALVHVADAVAQASFAERPVPFCRELIKPWVLDRLALDEARLQALCGGVAEQIWDVVARYS